MDDSLQTTCKSKPWNKGRLIGQKRPLKQREIWQIRANLEHERNVRELAMFDLAIDSKLRACDLMALRVRDVMRGDQITGRTVVLQRKTLRPVRFEITDLARQALDAWIRHTHLQTDDFLFPSRCKRAAHLSTRQYARIVGRWVTSIQLDRSAYGTHTMRRTKPTLIYRRTGNLRAVQLLLGHTKIESTVRYLGVEVDDALALAEQTEV
jgi:integrase